MIDRNHLVGPGMTGATYINLLNGLAWMGELSKEQIHRIWFPDYSARTVSQALQQLRREGIVQQINWNDKRKIPGEKKLEKPTQSAPPNMRKVLYTLVDDHMELIRSDPMYPPKPRGRGLERLRGHDHHTNEALTHLILHGRTKQIPISGLFLGYDYFLRRSHRQPRADALVVVHRREEEVAPHNLVPWTRYVGTNGEGRTDQYAMETDHWSLPPSALESKARAYAQCGTHQPRSKHGHMPTPCWIVKDEKRLWQIWNIWKEVWPHGFWRITTDEWLKNDRWYEYFQGEEFIGDQAVSIFDPVAS